jgi:hypothetical protein
VGLGPPLLLLASSGDDFHKSLFQALDILIVTNKSPLFHVYYLSPFFFFF